MDASRPLVAERINNLIQTFTFNESIQKTPSKVSLECHNSSEFRCRCRVADVRDAGLWADPSVFKLTHSLTHSLSLSLSLTHTHTHTHTQRVNVCALTLIHIIGSDRTRVFLTVEMMLSPR
ncbi:hypothetical protein QQF64_034865 [Cirrhinus molitorella]|uniref:Uncharacterized protein n=1 Tax=Cirrhinus molitorella TaxID=172907 RepID=A0ABR3NEH2_9TELE